MTQSGEPDRPCGWLGGETAQREKAGQEAPQVHPPIETFVAKNESATFSPFFPRLYPIERRWVKKVPVGTKSAELLCPIRG